MKIKKILFWFISLFFAIGGSVLYALSVREQLVDRDYIDFLDVPPSGDTVAIPIAGGFMLMFIVGMIHMVLHIIFLFRLSSIRGEKAHIYLIPGVNKKIYQNITIIIASLIVAFWIYEFIGTMTVIFFPLNFLFMIFAIATTLIYANWIMNFIRKYD